MENGFAESWHRAEVARHRRLRRWRPPCGCLGNKADGEYTRHEAIVLLENAIVKRREKNMNVNRRDPVLESLESELTMIYRDLDGAFDHLPLRLASAQKIVANLTPELFRRFLSNHADELAVGRMPSRKSLIHQFIREATGLDRRELALNDSTAALMKTDPSSTDVQMYQFTLPEWICNEGQPELAASDQCHATSTDVIELMTDLDRQQPKDNL